MKTLMTGLFALTLFVGFTMQASTANAAGGYHCRLSGQIHGASVAIFFGGEILSGDGMLTCKNEMTGRVDREPVTLRLAGGGAGFDFTIVDAIHVRSANIAVANPARLYGSFGIGATTGATLVNEGVEADVALQLSDRGGLNFDLGLQGRDAVGLGAHIYAMTFTIERR